MKIKEVPVCYHPTRVLFVDDNRKYLTHLSSSLDLNKFTFDLVFDPHKALEVLHSYHSDTFLKRCIEHPEENMFDHRNIDLNLRNISKEIYSPRRFSELSILVVDYAMPGLNGLALASECRLIKNNNFKILMLTGEADESIAVNAFNDRVIDKFIRKDAPDFEQSLNAAIAELQYQYFLDLSRIVIDSLTKDPEHPMINWLDEPVFFNLFYDLVDKYNLTEYYLADAFGSFMFLDAEGNPSWLVAKSEDEMFAAYETADMADDPVPKDMLQAMHDKKLVLYLHERGGLSDDVDELKRSLHPATKLVGNKTVYYYSYIDNPKAYTINSVDVLSYNAYRANLTR